jgi:hypothetical protein
MIKACLNKKRNPISKITRVKRDGSVAQAVECLPSKKKALSSNPSIVKERKEERKRERRCASTF